MHNSAYWRFLRRASSLPLVFFILVSAAGAQENSESTKPKIVQIEAGPSEAASALVGPPEAVRAEEAVPAMEPQPIAPMPEAKLETVPAETTAGLDSPVFSLLKVGGGIGIVIGLILGGFWAMKRIAPQYFARRGSGKMLRLIETLSMGEKRTIAIIEVAGKSYLVGNTTGQITLLAALQHLPVAADAGEEVSAADPQQQPKPEKGSFLNLYEAAKSAPLRAVRPVEIPPDIRGKMRELRQALEQ